MATNAADLDPELYPQFDLPRSVHRAFLGVASAALDAAEEKQPLDSSLALLEAALHDLARELRGE
jgi:HD superfamily phosphohydrolase YqeK